jgi:hypothetical protein
MNGAIERSRDRESMLHDHYPNRIYMISLNMHPGTLQIGHVSGTPPSTDLPPFFVTPQESALRNNMCVE